LVSNVVVSNERGLKRMVSNDLVSIVMEPLEDHAPLLNLSLKQQLLK